MPLTPSSLNLVQLTQTLKEQQQQYAQLTAAIARTLEEQRDQQRKSADAIADTLNRIGGLLSALLGGAAPATRRSATAPRHTQSAAKPATPPQSAAAMKRSATGRTKPGKVATSATDSLLGFIRQRVNPTTGELAEHWKSEGRAGEAKRVLGRLVKLKRLKRTPIPGARGNRYALP